MLAPHVGDEVDGGAGASCGYVLMTPADAFGGLLEVVTFPFEVSGQGLVESRGGVLTVAVGVLFQLSFAFRLERNEVHG